MRIHREFQVEVKFKWHLKITYESQVTTRKKKSLHLNPRKNVNNVSELCEPA